VFELLSVDDALRDAIACGVTSTALTRFAEERGHRSLLADAASKIVNGETSFSEVERVVGWWVR
jgi:type II secretory ATPase GspE/PulE/Tfp pilus assembly ATPase PilB-like protein